MSLGQRIDGLLSGGEVPSQEEKPLQGRHASVDEYRHCDPEVTDEGRVGRRTLVGWSPLRIDGPLATSLILGVLIAVELGRMLPATVIRPPARAASSAGLTLPAERPRGIEVSSIIAAHLFGVPTSDPGGQDPATAVPTSTDLVLVGTIATANPKRGVAIISDAGSAKVYRVGESLGPARLHSIYVDRVIIDRAGTLEAVILPRAGGGLVPQRVAGGAGPGPRAARLPQGEFGVFQDLMHTEAVTDPASGQLRGIRVGPGSDSDAFASAGLQSGDVIIAVNGVRLDNPQRREDVLEKIRNGPGVTLLVERQGHAQRMGIDFARFGLVASRNSAGGAEASD